MIDHLKDNYYNINLVDLKLSTPRMNAPHNINKPFETIIDQIKTEINFSDSGKSPYMP